MIRPAAAIMAPADAVVALAGEDKTFDLFPRPVEAPEAGRFRPVLIACPGGVPEEGGDGVPGDRLPPGTVLVWGHHRAGAAEAAGAAGAAEDDDGFVPALVLDRDAGPGALLRAALAAENRAGAYRWDELDRIHALAETIGEVGESTAAGGESRLTPDLAALIDPRREITDPVRRYRRFSQALQRALREELVDLRTAERVSSLPESVIEELLELSRDLSFSRRRQFLVAVEEVVRRDAAAEETVLAEVRHLPVMERFSRVIALRYPRMTRMETVVERVRRDRLRGSGVTLEPPARFEGDRYRVSFEIGSVRELRRRLQVVQRLEEEMDELLGILFEDPFDDTLAP